MGSATNEWFVVNRVSTPFTGFCKENADMQNAGTPKNTSQVGKKMLTAAESLNVFPSVVAGLSARKIQGILI